MILLRRVASQLPPFGLFYLSVVALIHIKVNATDPQLLSFNIPFLISELFLMILDHAIDIVDSLKVLIIILNLLVINGLMNLLLVLVDPLPLLLYFLSVSLNQLLVLI
jgi:hypothetical protein